MSIIGIVTKTNRQKDTKMKQLARKLAINCNCTLVYSYFNKIKKFFLFIFKSGYNWYKSYSCCIPTLIRSKLYLLTGYNWIQKIQFENEH